MLTNYISYKGTQSNIKKIKVVRIDHKMYNHRIYIYKNIKTRQHRK